MEKLLMADLKIAMKEKQKNKKETIQLVISKARSFAKDEKREVNDADFIRAIKSELKQTKDAFAQMEKYLSENKLNEYKEKLSILEKYLPSQLSELEIMAEVEKFFVRENLEKTSKSLGPAIKSLKTQLGDSADPGILSKCVKNYIG